MNDLMGLVTAPTMPEPPAPAVAAATVKSELWVRLELLLPGAAPCKDQSGAEGFLIAPGQPYRLRVQVGRVSQGDSGAFAVVGRADLRLSSAGGIACSSAGAPIVDGAVIDFDFSATQAAERLELVLARDDGSSSLARAIPLQLDVAHEPPQEMVDAGVFDLAAAPPDANVAFLYASLEADKLRAFGFHSGAGKVKQEPFMRPTSHLFEASTASVQDTRTMLVKVAELSDQLSLRDWLKKLCDLNASLIIHEDADSNVPWELIAVDGKHTPVGACMKVVRWPLVRHGNGAMPAELDPLARAGSLLSFGNYAEFKAQQNPEHDEVLRHGNHQPEIKGITDELEQLSSDVALVFLAVHGSNSREADGGGSVVQGKVTLRARDFRILDDVDGERPFAFFNACYSGRLGSDKHDVTGLPEVFLAKFVSSYLGCLGPVEQGVAAAIGASLLRAAREGGVDVPQLLLELRKKAALPRNKKNPAWRTEFFNTFMYVFYGPPSAHLTLKPAVPGASDG